MVNGIINQQTSRGATGSPGVGGAYAPSCLEPKLKAKKHGNHGSIRGFFQGHVSIFPMGNPLGLHPMSIF